MGALSGWLGYVILASLLVGFSWFTYSPNAPEWAGERFLLQCYMSGMRMMGLLTLPVPYVTGFKVSQIDAIRWLTELSYSNYIPDNDVFVAVSEATFDGVPVKIFRPRNIGSDAPAIIYIHGGGWVMLSADSYSATTYYMALKLNAVVISIDYRLAPEHPYPVPFEDCLKATTHFLRQAVKHDVDPKRVAISGDSAGGNLAAAVALKLSEDKAYSDLPKLKFQVLVYPVTQMVNFKTYSYTTYANTCQLSKELMIHMIIHYLGFPELQDRWEELAANNHTSQRLKNSKLASYAKHENLPEDFRVKGFQPGRQSSGNETLAAMIEPIITDPYFSPLMAPDLSKVPPTYMILAENDPLRDDGLLYLQRLRQAGVKTELDFHKTMHHGFALLSPTSYMTFQEGREAVDKLGPYVKKNL